MKNHCQGICDKCGCYWSLDLRPVGSECQDNPEGRHPCTGTVVALIPGQDAYDSRHRALPQETMFE